MPKLLQNGSFKDADGTAVANGTLVLTLSQDAQVIAGGNINARDLIAITLDSNGDVTGSPSVYGQDELNPGNTYYFAEVLNSGGSSVWGQTKWVISGASPINLDLMVPTLLNPDPAYSEPVLKNPSATQVITAFDLNPLPLGGGQSLGSLGSPWSVNINSVPSYLGVATASNGVPAVYGAINLVGQTAAITATTIFTPFVNSCVRISAYLKVVTAAATSSTLGPVTITYTDETDGTAQSLVMMLSTAAGAAATSSAGNTVNTSLNGSMIIEARLNQPIQFAVGYAANSANTMVYHVRLRAERV